MKHDVVTHLSWSRIKLQQCINHVNDMNRAQLSVAPTESSGYSYGCGYGLKALYIKFRMLRHLAKVCGNISPIGHFVLVPYYFLSLHFSLLYTVWFDMGTAFCVYHNRFFTPSAFITAVPHSMYRMNSFKGRTFFF